MLNPGDDPEDVDVGVGVGLFFVVGAGHEDELSVLGYTESGGDVPVLPSHVLYVYIQSSLDEVAGFTSMIVPETNVSLPFGWT